MVEIVQKNTEENEPRICDAHWTTIRINGHDHEVNICGETECTDCIFRCTETEENLKFLEELKAIASLQDITQGLK